MSAPDGMALLAALRDAVRTPDGRRVVGELAVEIRRVLDGVDEHVDPVVSEAARLLARRQPRARARGGRR